MTSMLRPYVTAGIALVGAGSIAVTPVTQPPAAQPHPVQLASDEDVTLAIGGSALPIPPPSYVQAVTDRFITPSFPAFTLDNAQALYTPEGLSPIFTPVKSLPLDTSVAQGVQILDSAINDQVADGNNVAVLGYSQSATISSIEMENLAAAGNPIPADALHFALIGDPSNPNGGLLERFEGLMAPTLGVDFSGATPPDTPYETDIYTLEYDGWADFPQYPLNFLSDLNAFAGIQIVHRQYPSLTDEELATKFQLSPSEGYDGNTTYWMIPAEHLPLMDLLREVPVVGKPVADLLEPALTQIVNLGYDNPDNLGWSVDPDVPTQFGLFPSSDQVMTAMDNMGPAIQQGVDAFMADLSNPSELLADLMPEAVAAPVQETPASFTDIVNALTAAASDAYAFLLPTTDIAVGVAVTIPAYDVQLFMDHLDNPMDAIGLPIAANTGLYTLAVGMELKALLLTIGEIQADLAGVMPF